MVKNKSKIKIAIGMSGGVDSSVAAKILKDQGYEVIGFMMKLWSGSEIKCDKDNACCDIDGLQDAKRIAAILDIPFYIIDVREKFKKEVADYFIEEYKNLRTPNPCVKCNEKIKFGWLLDFAKQTGCDYLATGHYARIASNGKFHLLKGKDDKKDQSYFLYRLNQDQLKHIIFPVGEFIKEETRALAKKWNLPVHEKKESQEICFIQEKDYRDFLKKNISEGYFKEGDIVDLDDNVVGKHQGLINYTIGQRRGIEQSIGLEKRNKEPLYAIGFNLEKNRLIVGKDQEVFSDSMSLSDLSWVREENLSKILERKKVKVKIRYRHPVVGIKSIHQHKDGSLFVNFKELQQD
ncbi:MAG: tRNA 2-thiouridine(34) synthase MnmA, partial [Patescibacteria group bacterium]|nr:tRNA 2-thiouridine(34) synthase MnmA [Patescibacteria group bacterium]